MSDTFDHYMDALEHFLEFGDEDDPEGVTCKRCGEENLEWRDFAGRWRLFDYRGRLHRCKVLVSKTQTITMGEKL